MTFDVAIVGAGLSGLSAAVALGELLPGSGRSIVVLDKARAPGGRLATRRIDGHVFDHGAQFFTARGVEFRVQVEVWCANGVVKEWCRGFPGSGSLDGTRAEDFNYGHPRYVCPAGMTALAKDLAARLPKDSLRFEQKVSAIRSGSGAWSIEVDGADPVFARKVIVTVPVSQATALFAEPVVRASCDRWAGKIGFDPCLALMLVIDPALASAVFPAPGARRFDGAVLSWGADNHRKGVSKAPGAITLHASPAFSRKYFDADPAAVARMMMEAACLPIDVLPATWQLKTWRYATPVSPVTDGFATLDADRSLYLAGDAFSGARVEGAWSSGQAVARAVAAVTA